jgi:WD40 repeat protein
MSFLTRLFGKGKKKINLQVTRVGEEKPEPKPDGTGTTLRKPGEASIPPQKKDGPKLTALEMAKRQDWEVKTLPEWKPGDVILDIYEVEDVISGGMGHVYIANHNKWNVKLAIKSPNKQMLSDRDLFARILREANSWVELGLHPNIAYCYYVRNIEDVPHIVVEYVDGGNLRQWIEDGKCIDYRTNLDLAIQFCHGMEYAHSKGMIHRDIKPANVLMTKDGTLKITDFGLVRKRGAGVGNQVSAVRNDKENRKQADHGLTGLGTFMGTQGYISPEQAEDPTKVDERADIFSFGVCLYEMFCGNQPYEITYGARQEPPDPVKLSRKPDFPVDLVRILEKCVKWDPVERYGSFSEIRQALSCVHTNLFKEESKYSDLVHIDLEADGLNNKGVSLFELGREEAAMECWQKAAEVDPVHFESNLNLSYYQWKKVKIADDVLKRRINRDLANNYDNSQYFCPTTRIWLESGMAPYDALKIIDDHLDAIESDDPIDKIFMQDLLKLKNDISVNGKPKKNLPTMACFATLNEHSGPVFCADFSPDDKYFLSGSADKTIRLWDVNTDDCIRVFKGHSDEVRAVAFLPGGRQFVSASFDMTLKIWDTDNPECVRTLKGHDFDITCLAVTKNGQRILSGSYNGIIKLWDMNTGDCLLTYQGHERGVTSVSLAPDNLTFVSTAFDNTMRVWSVGTGDCTHVFKETAYSVSSAKYSLDGRCLVAGCSDQLIRLIDIATGGCLKKFSGHTGEVSWVDISPNGKYILSGGRGGAHAGASDRSVRLWEMESGRCRCTLTIFSSHGLNINFVCFSNTGFYSISAGNDKTLKLWATSYPEPVVSLYTPALSKPVDFQELSEKKHTAQRACQKARTEMAKGSYRSAYNILTANSVSTGTEHDNIRELITVCGNKNGKRISLKNVWNCATYFHNEKVSSTTFSPDGKHTFSGSFDGQIKVLNLSDRRHHTLVSDTGIIYSLDISPDGKTLVSGHWQDKNQLQLWNAVTGGRLAGIDYPERQILSVAFSRNGQFIASGFADGSIHVIDTQSHTQVFSAQEQTDPITRVAFVNNDTRLLSRSQDKTIKSWDLRNKECVSTIRTPDKLLCLHPDKKHLIVGLTDLSMIDINTGETTWKAEDKGYSEYDSISITQDGRFILAGHRHPNIRVWDVLKNKVIKTMVGHQDSVPGLQFSKDNRYAISGSWDNSVRLWEFEWDWEFDH